jgi:hypothetical protein
LRKAVLQAQSSLFLCLTHSARYGVTMRFPPQTLLIAATVLLVSACGPADSDPGPGGVTAGDAKALDEAAKKLDERDKADADEAVN